MQNESSRAFVAFKEYYEYRREAGHDWKKFIVEFEKRYHKVKTSLIGPLSSGVQAFFLLMSANLPLESEKLARATADLDYDSMRDKLMKIFGDPGVLDTDDMAPEIKQEVLYSQGFGGRRGRSFRRNSWSRGGARGGFRGSRSNSVDRRKQCYECEGYGHIARDCPERQVPGQSKGQSDINFSEVQQPDVYEQGINMHITLVSSQSSSLLADALGKGVLDSGCSKTVAGLVWYIEFLVTLSKPDRQSVVEKKSNSAFRFGDGKQTRSVKVFTLPIYFGKTKFRMDVEIVTFDIPLLISNGAMRQMGMGIDFKTDIVTVNGHQMKLWYTNSGHPCIPISNYHVGMGSVNYVFHLENLDGLSREQLKAKALKLHQQFSHPTCQKLLCTLRETGCKNKDLFDCVQEISDNCEF